MDLHDYNDVASNYDKYINELVGMSRFDNHTCIEFHLELAKEYGSDGIIDIACGTGLIMLPLLKEGYNVTGIDISEEMINQTSMKIENEGIDKNYNLICSSMAEFQLKELASLAIIPRSGFLHLIRQDDQISALKSINKNLVMDGILSLNTFFHPTTLYLCVVRARMLIDFIVHHSLMMMEIKRRYIILQNTIMQLKL